MENVTVNVILNNATTFLGISQETLFYFLIVCIILLIIVLFVISYNDKNCFSKLVQFGSIYKFWLILAILIFLLSIVVGMIFNNISFINIDIVGYYIALIGIIVSILLVLKQLNHENRVNSYKLLEKILNSLKEIDKTENKMFSFWVIKQMLLNRHVLFYDIQIRLAYLYYIKNGKGLPLLEKDFMLMKQDEIEDLMEEIYDDILKEKFENRFKKERILTKDRLKKILDNMTLENLDQYKTLEFRVLLLEYLDDLILSKCAISFLNFITQDTYEFYNKGYLYHLPSSNYKLKNYLSELKNFTTEKSDNKECIFEKTFFNELKKYKLDNSKNREENILKDIWIELNRIIEEGNP